MLLSKCSKKKLKKTIQEDKVTTLYRWDIFTYRKHKQSLHEEINVLKSHIDYKKDVPKVLRKDNEKNS